MRALVYSGSLDLDTDYPVPEPNHNESLLRVLKAGICNTDIEIVKGYMDFQGILGHEFVALVENGPLKGKRVAGEINLNCQRCSTCLGGAPTQCPHRTTLGISQKDGAIADYVTLPDHLLHVLPDSLSDDQAVFIEPLAAAFQALVITHIKPTHRVVLIGTGKLGILVAQVVALTGCSFAAISRHQHQRDILSKWGIDTALPGEVEARGADIVMDCTGTADGFADALNLVRPRGIIHLKSTYHGLPEADLTRVVVDEIAVVSSRCGPFDAAIRALQNGLVDVEPLVEAHFSLDEALSAFDTAGQRGMLKIILDIA
jgi:threonine dehydrogenase-like Zn-dependent dehydrogenase